jgi:hypothetical protein
MPISDLGAKFSPQSSLNCFESAARAELDCRRFLAAKRPIFPPAPHELTNGEAADYPRTQPMAEEAG